MISQLSFGEPWVEHLGWTLLQFLWQGTLLSAAYAMALALAGRWLDARVRYSLACGTLAAMAGSPVVTWFVAGSGAMHAQAVSSWPLPSATAWQQALPWLVVCWVVGVVFCSLRLIGGWRMAARLRRVGVRPAPAEWQQALESLVARVGATRPVRLLVSSLVEAPTVVGWLRPVILVPVGALAGMAPEHVEALLAHELAHIRRLDYLVNILQSVAEAVLFYHPAVWWISSRIRHERELCCDDVAVAVTGDALVYARALAEFELQRAEHAYAALSANGGSLLDRIRRLIGEPPARSHTLPGPGAAGAMSLLWLAGLGAVAAHGAPAARVVPMPMAPAAPVAAPMVEVQRNAEESRHPVLSALLFSPFGPAAPAPQVGRGASGGAQSRNVRIEGQVTDVSGTPVPRATVLLLGLSNADVVAGDDGKFAFEDVAPGQYRIEASKPGFLAGAYGERAPGLPAAPVTVAQGVPLRGISIKLTPQAVITGQITNMDGDVVPSAAVVLYRRKIGRGGVRLESVTVATSNDEGNFRIPNLAAGRYYLRVTPAPVPRPLVAATAQGGRSGAASQRDLEFAYLLGYSAAQRQQGTELAKSRTNGLAEIATFYPNAVDADGASPLNLTAGARLEHIDIRIRRERVYTVTGKFVWDGAPVTMGSVKAERAEVAGSRQVAVTVVSNGAFEFQNLPPGTYRLTGTSFRSASSNNAGGGAVDAGVSLYARSVAIPRSSGKAEAEVVVSDNVDGVMLTADEVVALQGKVVVESDGADGAGLTAGPFIQLVPIDSRSVAQTTRVQSPDGSFSLNNVAPGQYLLNMGDLPQGTYLRSASYGGRDVLNAPIAVAGGTGSLGIVLAGGKPAGVSGVVRDSSGKPLSGVTVTIWPKKPQLGLQTLGLRTAATDQNGRFQVDDLAPDYYYVAAWDGEAPNSGLFEVPEFLTAWDREAAAVELTGGAQATVDPKLISAEAIAAEAAKLR